MVKVFVDGREYEVEEGTTVYEFMQRNGIQFWRPYDVPQLQFIHNEDCPLIYIVEVDGKLANPKILKQMKVKDGMTINTKSKLIEEKLTERLNWLKE